MWAAVLLLAGAFWLGGKFPHSTPKHTPTEQEEAPSQRTAGVCTEIRDGWTCRMVNVKTNEPFLKDPDAGRNGWIPGWVTSPGGRVCAPNNELVWQCDMCLKGDPRCR